MINSLPIMNLLRPISKASTFGTWRFFIYLLRDGILGVGFPLHKPYPYSLDRWGFLHLGTYVIFGKTVNMPVREKGRPRSQRTAGSPENTKKQIRRNNTVVCSVKPEPLSVSTIKTPYAKNIPTPWKNHSELRKWSPPTTCITDLPPKERLRARTSGPSSLSCWLPSCELMGFLLELFMGTSRGTWLPIFIGLYEINPIKFLVAIFMIEGLLIEYHCFPIVHNGFGGLFRMLEKLLLQKKNIFWVTILSTLAMH